MAPEQAAGRPVDARCDLFSLGCVLYRMATGTMPFKGTDTISTLMAVSTEEPPAPREIDAALPVALSDLIMKLLAKKPGDRCQSAAEVVKSLDALEKAPASEVTAKIPSPAAARSPSPQSGDERRTPKSRRNVALLGGLLGLAAAIVAAVFIIRVPTPEGEFIVEVQDDSIAVAIDKQGGLKVIDRQSGREYVVMARQSKSLPAGEYELVVADPKADLELSARTFTIKGKDTTRVKVSFEKSAEAKVAQLPIGVSFDALRRESIAADELAAAGGGDPSQAPAELVAILGDSRLRHWTQVRSAAFSKDNQRVASADGTTVWVWDVATGRALLSIQSNGAADVAFSPDGTRLATSNEA